MNEGDIETVAGDGCVVCGEWPAEHRAYLRWFIYSMPLDAVCDLCVHALFVNIAALPGIECR